MDDNELQDKLDDRPVDDVARLAEKHQMDDKVIEIMVSGAIGIPHGHNRRKSPRYVGAELGIKDAIKALTAAGYEITKRDDTMVTVPREPTYAMTLAGHKATKHQFDLHGAYTKLFTAMIEAYEAEKTE